MPTYVLRDGLLCDKQTGEPARIDPHAPVAAPMVMRDVPEYQSPIDGRPITSRSHRREDLKRNNCIEWDAAASPTRGKPEFKNKRFAKKYNLPIGEKAQ